MITTWVMLDIKLIDKEFYIFFPLIARNLVRG
jgi:hypothetical protein